MLGDCSWSGFSVALEEESGWLREGPHGSRASSSCSQNSYGQASILVT